MEKEKVTINKKELIKNGIKLIGSHCVTKVVTEALRNTTSFRCNNIYHDIGLYIGTGIISWCVSDYCINRIEDVYNEFEEKIMEACKNE